MLNQYAKLEQENKFIDNKYTPTYSPKSNISIHNDSVDKAALDIQKRRRSCNPRQWLIKQVFLPQRSRKVNIGTIHSMYSLTVHGLCSYNKMTWVVFLLSLFIYAHFAWLILLVISQIQMEKNMPMLKYSFIDEATKKIMIPFILVLGVYPLLFAILSNILLLSDVIFGTAYEALYSWHRNSLLQLWKVMAFASCIIPALLKIHLLFCTKCHFSRDVGRETLLPVVILSFMILLNVSLSSCLLTSLIQISCARHKNTFYWLIICSCMIV